LTARGITPGVKSDYLDLTATLATLSPEGTFFGHDKVDGVFPIDGGSKLFVSNHSDLGLKGTVAGATNPFALDPKINADGTQDQGDLEVDLTKLPATATVSTVTITVAAATAPPGSTTTSTTGAAAGGALAATGATPAPAPALGLAALALLAGGAVVGLTTSRRRAAR
jgi:hypothetical protein